MSAPLPPPVPDWAASTPEWSPPAAWAPPSTPPSPPPSPGAGAPAAAGRRPGAVVLAVVALLGVVAGSVAATLLVTAAFVGSAEDIGREVGDGIAASMSEAMARSMEDSSFSIDEEFGWGAGAPVAPEDIAEPVPPVPGPDPVLNAYAQGCFDGDYQACDNLFFESPPLSDYEEYGGTCAGRVKLMSVMACTDLD